MIVAIKFSSCSSCHAKATKPNVRINSTNSSNIIISIMITRIITACNCMRNCV